MSHREDRRSKGTWDKSTCCVFCLVGCHSGLSDDSRMYGKDWGAMGLQKQAAPRVQSNLDAMLCHTLPYDSENMV